MDYLWKVGSKAKEMASTFSQKEEVPVNPPDSTKSEASSSFPADLTSEKPASSLSLETQQGNSDREISSESEAAASQPAQSPSGDSNRTLEGAEESEKSGLKMPLSAGDLKGVSNKAVEGAKSIGSFLYGFANKAGRTVSETAKQLKTTVEENSILGDFNKEQQAFASSKNGEAKEELPPWAGTEDEENVKKQVLSLSEDRRNFLRSPPSGVLFDFNFDTMHPTAKIMLKEDPALEKMRFEIVPKLVNEETFWRNYFYRVSLVKQSSRLSKMKKRSDSSSTSEGSSSEHSIKDLDKTCSKAIDAKADVGNSVSTKEPNVDDWEKEMQQELQDYEVVADGNDDDADWEKEMERMLEDKGKDVA